MKRKTKRRTKKKKSFLQKLTDVRLNTKVMLATLFLATLLMGGGIYYNTKSSYLDGCTDTALVIFGLPDAPEIRGMLRSECLRLWNG